MKKLFTAHPKSVDETYLTHLKFASNSGLKLIYAGIACIIHSLLPFLFKTTASNTVLRMNQSMSSRGSKNHTSVAEN